MITENKVIRKIAHDVIESSLDNTAGLVISRRNIFKTVRQINSSNESIDSSFVDEIMTDNESPAGYLVKASDFRYAFRNNIDLLMELYEE